MAMAIVTLTTDYGEDSAYAAALKGSLLRVCPEARLYDLSHSIPPQDIVHAAFFLSEAIPWFPPQTIHVVVVDPGVGTARRLLYVEWQGQRILAPDNGVCTLLWRRQPAERILQLQNRQYFHETVSNTFHGRDILAPVAGHLANGLDPALLGPEVTDPVHLPFPQPRPQGEFLLGEIVFVDHFGNLLSNIHRDDWPGLRPVCVEISGIRPRWVRTYGEASRGEIVALWSSGGWLEIAVVEGHAAHRLNLGRGAPVLVTFARAENCP
ncbi:MAG: SAM-dependent chlorinase/fluorinase [Gemmatales bacterium]|nr:SAM-dependent chlorinase/fluorinase [Gemmatales bacterium]MDW7994261.1 SAM-dependent chlorinase/fluorinase [Gemmatales bacterium]